MVLALVVIADESPRSSQRVTETGAGGGFHACTGRWSMSNTTRPHATRVIEEMESFRAHFRTAIDVIQEITRGIQPECWQAGEDCDTGFRFRDELLGRHDDE